MRNIKLPENASYFQISKMGLNKCADSFSLDLIDPISGDVHTLEFIGLMYLSMSKSPCNEDGIFQIGDIELIAVSDPSRLLRKIGYEFKGVEFDPNTEYIYLRVEGDICLNVVSGSFRAINM